MGHEITPDEDFASLDIDRVVHQIYYKDFRKEIALEGGMKFDFFTLFSSQATENLKPEPAFGW